MDHECVSILSQRLASGNNSGTESEMGPRRRSLGTLVESDNRSTCEFVHPSSCLSVSVTKISDLILTCLAILILILTKKRVVVLFHTFLTSSMLENVKTGL